MAAYARGVPAAASITSFAIYCTIIIDRISSNGAVPVNAISTKNTVSNR